MREVFVRRARGSSWREVAEYLEHEGVKTAWGNPYWTPGSLRNLVMNRAYLGEAWQGALVNPQAHEAIVTEKEWTRAQPEARVILPKEESRSAVCILRGVIVCGGCGKRMLVGWNTKNGEPNAPHYYCRRRPPTASARAVQPRAITLSTAMSRSNY